MGDVLVLAYHALSPAWPAALSIPPERFETQLQVLSRLGYESVTFTQAVRGPRVRKAVAITFDDGFRSVIERGLPILARNGFVASVFVPTTYVGWPGPCDWPNVNRWVGGPHNAELEPMSWSELARLVAAGWEIGSHACSHPHLPRLDDERLREELVSSRLTCERMLGTECTALAYPYGEVDRRVMDGARRAGYAAAAALPARIHRPHRFRWPRVGIWHNDTDRVFLAKLSRVQRRRLDLRTGELRPLPRYRFSTP